MSSQLRDVSTSSPPPPSTLAIARSAARRPVRPAACTIELPTQKTASNAPFHRRPASCSQLLPAACVGLQPRAVQRGKLARAPHHRAAGIRGDDVEPAQREADRELSAARGAVQHAGAGRQRVGDLRERRDAALRRQ